MNLRIGTNSEQGFSLPSNGGRAASGGITNSLQGVMDASVGTQSVLASTGSIAAVAATNMDGAPGAMIAAWRLASQEEDATFSAAAHLASLAQAVSLAQATYPTGRQLLPADGAAVSTVGRTEFNLSGVSAEPIRVSPPADAAPPPDAATSPGAAMPADGAATVEAAPAGSTSAMQELQELRTALSQQGLFQTTTDENGNTQLAFNRGMISESLQSRFSNVIDSIDQFVSDVNTEFTPDEIQVSAAAFLTNIGKFVETTISVVVADHNDVQSAPNAPRVPSYGVGDLNDTRSFLTATRGVLFRSGNPEAFGDFLDATKTVADRATATGNNDMLTAYLQHFGTFERQGDGTVGGTTFAAHFGAFSENASLGSLISEFAAVTQKAATNLAPDAFVAFQNAVVGLSANIANPDSPTGGGLDAQRMAEFLGRADSMLANPQDRTQAAQFAQTAASLSGPALGTAFDEFLGAVDSVRALSTTSSAGLQQFLTATDAVVATGNAQNVANFLAKAGALANERPDELAAFLDGVIGAGGVLPNSNTVAHGVDQGATPLTIENQMTIATPSSVSVVKTDAAAGTISIDFGVAVAGYGVTGGAIGTEFDVIATEHSGDTQVADISFEVSYSAWMADVDLSAVTGIGAIYSAGAAASKEGAKAAATAVVGEIIKQGAKSVQDAIVQEGVTAVGTALATSVMNDLYSDATDDLDFNGFVLKAYLVDVTAGGEIIGSMTVAEGSVTSVLGNGAMVQDSGDDPMTLSFDGVALQAGHTYQVVLVAEMGGVAVGAAGGTAGGVDASLSNVSINYRNDASTEPLVVLAENPDAPTAGNFAPEPPAGEPITPIANAADTAQQARQAAESAAALTQKITDKATAHAQQEIQARADYASEKAQQAPATAQEAVAHLRSDLQNGNLAGNLTGALAAERSDVGGGRIGIAAPADGTQSTMQAMLAALGASNPTGDPRSLASGGRQGQTANVFGQMSESTTSIRDVDMAAEAARLTQLASAQAVVSSAAANVDRRAVLQLLQ